MKQAYQDSLVQLQSVSIAPETMETKNGFSALAVQALKPFAAFSGTLTGSASNSLQLFLEREDVFFRGYLEFFIAILKQWNHL